jgi:hypothetical protein
VLFFIYYFLFEFPSNYNWLSVLHSMGEVNILGLSVGCFKIFFCEGGPVEDQMKWLGWRGMGRCGQSSNASPVILRLTLLSILSKKFNFKCNSTVALKCETACYLKVSCKHFHLRSKCATLALCCVVN